MAAANLEKIKVLEFQSRKEKILLLHYLLENIKNLNPSQVESLAGAILVGRDRDKQTILKLLKDIGKGEKSWLSMLPQFQRGSKLSKEEILWRDALNYATSQISDSCFLSDFMAPAHSCLNDATAEAGEIAYTCLAERIASLESVIHQKILSIQNEECNRQAQYESKSEEDRELSTHRSYFTRQIEDLSREHSKSCVLYLWVRSNDLTYLRGTTIFIDSFTKKKGHWAYSPGLLGYSVRLGLSHLD
jgi:hypothetical protein